MWFRAKHFRKVQKYNQHKWVLLSLNTPPSNWTWKKLSYGWSIIDESRLDWVKYMKELLKSNNSVLNNFLADFASSRSERNLSLMLFATFFLYTLLTIFHANGAWPDKNDLFSGKHGESAITAVHSFMMCGERRSISGDLFGFNFLSTSQTSFVLQWIFDNCESTILSYSGKLA